MTQPPALERRYRRLLAWYPAEHRSLHGEEMIGVLLAGARAGQARPTPSDALDLIIGALRIRLRSLLAGRLDSKLTDAIAVYSVIVPVMLLMNELVWGVGTNYRWLSESSMTPLLWRLQPLGFDVLFLMFVVVPPILSWRGHRRTAVVVALVPAVFAMVLSFRPSGVIAGSAASLLLMVQAVALAISPGPRRGLPLLGKPALVVACAAGVASAMPFTPQTDAFLNVPAGEGILLVVGVVAAIFTAMLITLRAQIGYRLIALLAVPVYLFAISLPLTRAPAILISYSLAIVYLPCLALWIAIAITSWLGRRRRVKATG